MNRNRRRLRSGFTTGTAAAAATKAALIAVLDGRPPASVTIPFLGDRGSVVIGVDDCPDLDPEGACCFVTKDAGDDPDVTHQARIGARVRIAPAGPKDPAPSVSIRGGEGVGRITRPGLELPVGAPAINPGPRRMIQTAVTDVLDARGLRLAVTVEILVPRGRELAQKTLNARLGIVDGISILGTTGIVRPMSHEAYIATIRSALSVARAAGHRTVVLTTGRRSERFAQARWPELAEEQFVQIGDFFGAALEQAAARGFDALWIAVFFGKALKMAEGHAHTHAARAEVDLARLAGWIREETGDIRRAEAVAAANTAREAFFSLYPHAPEVVDAVARRVVAAARGFSGDRCRLRAVILDYDGRPAADWREDG